MSPRTLRWLMLLASAVAVSLFIVWTSTERSAGSLAAQVKTDPVADNARLLEQGRRVFRETFGDEAFWGDTLKLHQAIAGAKLGGVGPGVSPKMALSVGVKVDVDAVPAAIAAALKAGKVDLDDPASTLGVAQGTRGGRPRGTVRVQRSALVGRRAVRVLSLDRG